MAGATALGLTLVTAAGVARLPGLDAVAHADAISDAKAKAARIAGQRVHLTQEAERLNEQANAAQDELAKVDGELAVTQAKLSDQRDIAQALRTQATDLAVQSYMRGDSAGGVGSLVSADGATDLQLRQGYAPLALGRTTDVLDQARAATQDTERLSARLDAVKSDQTRLLATIAARRKAIEKTQTQLATLAKQVDGDLVRLVAEEEARKAAEAERIAAAKAKAEEARLQAAQAEQARQLAATQAAQAQAAQAARTAAMRAAAATTAATAKGSAPATPAPGAPATSAPKGSPRTTAPTPRSTAPAAGSGDAAPVPAGAPQPAPEVPDVSNYPAPSPAAAVAVAEALRQLGKPYVFGADGPDTFDCSGLMMWAWAKAGVSMPHYTVSQYHAFPHVPLSEVAPGDLVFFNVNLGHVGMYIGGGQYVQAPRTGDVVKVSNLAGRNVVGVVRPG